MPFWVYGRDASSGRARDPLFFEDEDEQVVRAKAVEEGMSVEEIERVGTESLSGKAPPSALDSAREGIQRKFGRGQSAPVPTDSSSADTRSIASVANELPFDVLVKYWRRIGAFGAVLMIGGLFTPVLKAGRHEVPGMDVLHFGPILLTAAAAAFASALWYSGRTLLVAGLVLLMFLTGSWICIVQSNSRLDQLKLSSVGSAPFGFPINDPAAMEKQLREMQAQTERLRAEMEAYQAKTALSGTWTVHVEPGWGWILVISGALVATLAGVLGMRSESSSLPKPARLP